MKLSPVVSLQTPSGEAHIPLALIERLSAVARAGYARVPWGGVELGGILVGRVEEGAVHIDEARQIECEHDCGPSWHLSKPDLEGLEAAISKVSAPLQVVGWYRTTSRDLGLTNEDSDLAKQYFPQSWQIALIVQRGKEMSPRFGVFARNAGAKAGSLFLIKEFTGESVAPQVPAAAEAGGAADEPPAERPPALVPAEPVPAPLPAQRDSGPAPASSLASPESLPAPVEPVPAPLPAQHVSGPPKPPPAQSVPAVVPVPSLPPPESLPAPPAPVLAEPEPLPAPVVSEPDPEPPAAPLVSLIGAEPPPARLVRVVVPAPSLIPPEPVPPPPPETSFEPEPAIELEIPAPPADAPKSETTSGIVEPEPAGRTLPGHESGPTSKIAPTPIRESIAEIGRQSAPVPPRPKAVRKPPDSWITRFGLDADPFGLAPDPAFFYESPSHREAVAVLEYGITARKGVLVLTGDVGAGKSTVLELLTDRLRTRRIAFARVLNSRLTATELFELITHDLDLNVSKPGKIPVFFALHELAAQRNAAGSTVALLVDDAHKLALDVLEEIEMLNNIEARTGKLVQLVLAGQPELEELLNDPRLRGLRQRIVLRARLTSLSAVETAGYIDSRWRTAGGTESPFTSEMTAKIHHRTAGIPRRVNQICAGMLERAWMFGDPLTPELVDNVADLERR